MKLTKAEIGWLLLLVVVAGLLTLLLRNRMPLGTDLGENPIVQAVRQDHMSPATNNPAADVTLIAFTDYRCPACRLTYPEMKRAVAKDGKVRVVYKDWPIFGAQSEDAARVAIASSFQGIYPKVHDQLMTSPGLDEVALRRAVEDSGGDWNRLQVDLANRHREIGVQIAQNQTQAFSLALGGTPGFLIGPILVRGALNEGQFSRAIARARESN